MKRRTFGVTVAAAALNGFCKVARSSDKIDYSRYKGVDRRVLTYKAEPTRPMYRPSRRRVIPVLYLPSDRKPDMPIDDCLAKIRTLLAFANEPFRDVTTNWAPGDREKHGLAFQFERDKHDIAVQVIRSSKPTNAFVSNDQTYQYNVIYNELMNSEALPIRSNPVLVVFAETYLESVDDSSGVRVLRNLAACGSHKLALISSWILKDECSATTIEGQLKLLADETHIKNWSAPGADRNNSSLCYQYAQRAIGLLVHEIGHALKLSDTKNPAYTEDLMWHGPFVIRRNFLPDVPGIKAHFTAADAQRLRKFKGSGLT